MLNSGHRDIALGHVRALSGLAGFPVVAEMQYALCCCLEHVADSVSARKGDAVLLWVLYARMAWDVLFAWEVYCMHVSPAPPEVKLRDFVSRRLLRCSPLLGSALFQTRRAFSCLRPADLVFRQNKSQSCQKRSFAPCVCEKELPFLMLVGYRVHSNQAAIAMRP